MRVGGQGEANRVRIRVRMMRDIMVWVRIWSLDVGMGLRASVRVRIKG